MSLFSAKYSLTINGNYDLNDSTESIESTESKE
jgi:hypothetical protein